MLDIQYIIKAVSSKMLQFNSFILLEKGAKQGIFRVSRVGCTFFFLLENKVLK